MEKLVIYGDSLSTGTHGDGAYLADLRAVFAPQQFVNCAVGSSGCSLTTPNSMMEKLQQRNPACENSDLILVWHGTNDWYWGTPQGSLTQETPYTWLGSIRLGMRLLRERNPHALIVWATPLYRFECPDGCGDTPGDAAVLQNRVGLTQADYTAALRQAADRLYFPLIETGRECGICAQNADRLLEDRVHPNAAGYRRISRVLIHEISRLLYLHSGSDNERR